VAALCCILAQAETVEPTTDASPAAKLAILYNTVAWGNPVDYGSSLVPLRAYESLAAYDAAKMKMAEASPHESRNLAALRCSIVKTSDEELLAKMLMSKRQKSIAVVTC
jgi:hypothetical protein